ncbi:cupin [Paenibacillus sp. 481]|uniref:cupin n=1 Tax=Paenibacillus sp. 481 TaxID=2835869 RepID=UPI001E3D39A9|nr:cupin [Paenibacillus sp. 481]UHA74310.1 cupin [Paenibacillus sp. 481]
MQFFTFSKDSGKPVTRYDSQFVMSRIVRTDAATHIGCMHLDANDIIGYHQAVVPQLLLVMNGEGYVRGEKEEYVHVQAGDAVFWDKDEWHETKTSHGLTAIVIESEQLTPSVFMPVKK